MTRDHATSPGLDFFWEQADIDASDEHPLERELAHRLDACSRYRALIAEAQAGGHESRVEALIAQHEREELLVRRLREALLRMRRAKPPQRPRT
ncbi:MAG: hypothetical protein IRZ00_00290 [Gemmatimonadetes bacterium]|nr:hypothetical protein [Gemmatimonadota bacterium]